MKVLFVASGNDTGGLTINMKRAFDRYGKGWTARAVRFSNNGFDWPADIEWPRQRWEARMAFDEADVIHVMERPGRLFRFGDVSGKVVVVQHLGTYYRNRPEEVSAACQRIGALEFASSHDLMLMPHLGWLPITTDMQYVRSFRKRRTVHKRVRIAHAPTNREIKSTDLIVATIERLALHHPIDFDLIEGVPWAECLERKSRADLFVDELTLGFGSNALEAWLLGMPVVSGVQEPVRSRMLRDFPLPFVEATPETLYDVLEKMITNPYLRWLEAKRGLEHVRQFHSPQQIVERSIDIYQRARGSIAA